jgi:hypothetical protein
MGAKYADKTLESLSDTLIKSIQPFKKTGGESGICPAYAGHPANAG